MACMSLFQTILNRKRTRLDFYLYGLYCRFQQQNYKKQRNKNEITRKVHSDRWLYQERKYFVEMGNVIKMNA